MKRHDISNHYPQPAKPGALGTWKDMRTRLMVFALFATAMLFSITREWCAPSACPRLRSSWPTAGRAGDPLEVTRTTSAR